MGRRAGNRLARAGQCRQPCCQVYAGPVDIDPVAPRHRGVDSGAQVEMLVFGHAGVLRGKCPVHRRGGISGVRHRLETHQEAVTQTLYQNTAIARQYLSSDDTDKVCPSANGEGFVLSHEPHRFHEIDQQHDGLLAHECDARARNNKSPSLGGLFFAFVHRPIVHVEPISRSRLCILDGMEPHARAERKALGIRSCQLRRGHGAQKRSSMCRNSKAISSCNAG